MGKTAGRFFRSGGDPRIGQSAALLGVAFAPCLPRKRGGALDKASGDPAMAFAGSRPRLQPHAAGPVGARRRAPLPL